MKSEFYTKNRKRLQKQAESGLLIVAAHSTLQRTADTTFPFRQDSNFWYLTGIEEPDVVLVMDNGDHYLILPELGEAQTVLDGAIEPKELQAPSGISKIFSNKQGWEKLAKRVKSEKKVAILHPSGPFIDHYGFYTNPSRETLRKKLIGIGEDTKLEDLRPLISKMRVIKQETELIQIQKAIDITKEAVLTVAKNIETYEYEYQIEADISYIFRSSGAIGHAFSPIVSSGKSATTIHNMSNNLKLDKKDLVLLDIGAEFNNYSADIARTLPLSEPSKRQQQVIEAVVEVQKYAFSILKPGLSFRDYEYAVEEYMGRVLKKLSLISDLSRDNIRKYFPHATSHFLGLDTHDTGDRYSSVFEPNMVIAVEPSILIPDESIGARIEDDVLITKNGIKNLSADLPSTLR